MNRETMTPPHATPRDHALLPPVEIAVTHVATSHARYEWDGACGVIRLAGVQSPGDESYEAAPLDWGELTIAESIAPVLIVRRVPTFPGCHLTGRVIGLHEQAGTRTFVAVPTADPAFQRITTVRDLPAQTRALITQAVPSGTWHDVDVATAWYRQTVTEQRTERAHQRRLGGRMWQATTTAASADDMRGEAGRHSTAEYHLHDVPARFLDYVAELLLPTERILALVHRPPPPSHRGFFRREALPEALLLVTDRQMLLMADALPPDVTMVRWGFVAESGALGRLVTTTLDDVRRMPTLTAFFSAATGLTAVKFALPNGREVLATVLHILHRFIPRPGSRAMQRRDEIWRESDNWAALRQFWRHDPNQWERFTDLRKEALQMLTEGELVCHYAVDPAWDKDRAALLLALTPSRLICAEEGVPLEHLRLGAIASASLQHAPIGSWFGVTVPEGSRMREYRFHCYAFTYAAFAGLFTLLRQGIGTSPASGTQYQEREAADG